MIIILVRYPRYSRGGLAGFIFPRNTLQHDARRRGGTRIIVTTAVSIYDPRDPMNTVYPCKYVDGVADVFSENEMTSEKLSTKGLSRRE